MRQQLAQVLPLGVEGQRRCYQRLNSSRLLNAPLFEQRLRRPGWAGRGGQSSSGLRGCAPGWTLCGRMGRAGTAKAALA